MCCVTRMGVSAEYVARCRSRDCRSWAPFLKSSGGVVGPGQFPRDGRRGRGHAGRGTRDVQPGSGDRADSGGLPFRHRASAAESLQCVRARRSPRGQTRNYACLDCATRTCGGSISGAPLESASSSLLLPIVRCATAFLRQYASARTNSALRLNTPQPYSPKCCQPA